MYGRLTAPQPSTFGHVPYHVGSSLKTKDWRDVDVRLILPDDEFVAMFGPNPNAIGNPKLSAITLAFCALGKEMTGLPIDFQVQSTTHANSSHPGWRSALIEDRPCRRDCRDDPAEA